MAERHVSEPAELQHPPPVSLSCKSGGHQTPYDVHTHAAERNSQRSCSNGKPSKSYHLRPNNPHPGVLVGQPSMQRNVPMEALWQGLASQCMHLRYKSPGRSSAAAGYNTGGLFTIYYVGHFGMSSASTSLWYMGSQSRPQQIDTNKLVANVIIGVGNKQNHHTCRGLPRHSRASTPSRQWARLHMGSLCGGACTCS